MLVHKHTHDDGDDYSDLPLSFFVFVAFFEVAFHTSFNVSPPNTSATAVHCGCVSALPFHNTESRMLQNFLVVVIVVLMSEPKLEIVRKMKSCPNAPQRQYTSMSMMTRGCDCAN